MNTIGKRPRRTDGTSDVATNTPRKASCSAAVAASIEQIWLQYHYDDVQPWPKIAPRQGSLRWSRGYLVLPAKTGACMITPTPAPQALRDWLIEETVREAKEVVAPGEAITTAHLPALDALAGHLALRHDAAWLLHEAQKRHLAWGQVQTVRDLEAKRGALQEDAQFLSTRRQLRPIPSTRQRVARCNCMREMDGASSSRARRGMERALGRVRARSDSGCTAHHPRVGPAAERLQCGARARPGRRRAARRARHPLASGGRGLGAQLPAGA